MKLRSQKPAKPPVVVEFEHDEAVRLRKLALRAKHGDELSQPDEALLADLYDLLNTPGVVL